MSDFFATFIEVAGLNQNQNIDGVSFLPMIKGGKSPRSWAYSESKQKWWVRNKAYKLYNNGNISKYHKLINPEKKIQPFVEKLTGLNNKMLENKPVFSEISQEINSFTKGCVFVAHNVKFDYRVLKKEFSRIGMKFQRDLLCTIELSKIVFPEMKSYSLGKLVSNLGIEIKNRHRADGDAEATLNLFVLLTKNIERDKLDKLVSFENE